MRRAIIKPKILRSRFHSDRSDPAGVDVVVLHSMYAPGTRDPFSAQNCKRILDRHEVSAHFLINRRGGIFQCVDVSKKAWHAGISKMPLPDGREGVNDFSIGIELIGAEHEGRYTIAQYRALERVLRTISHSYLISAVVTHRVIAPDRKSDPWNLDSKITRAIVKNVFKRKILVAL